MDTIFKRNDNADYNDTSFHDVEIYGSLEKLTEILGAPILYPDGYKTKHEWVMEGDDGTMVTVYDYRYDGSKEGHWHVGGRDRLACLKFKNWFEDQ